MTEAEKKKLLSACRLFEGLDEAAIEEAARFAEEAYFPVGEALFGDEDGRRIGVIHSGYARVTKLGREGGVAMSLLSPGSVFGAATLMADELPSTRAIAIKPVTALLIAEEDFLRLMEEHFLLTKNYCRYLIGRIRFLTDRVECMAGGTAAEKLMLYLEKNQVNGSVHLPFGAETLASALSLSRASLYRAFDELEKSGRISRKGHDFKLL